MNVSFNGFQFDCEQKILTKNGRIIPLSEKPAQLLSLFIQKADKIHSKSDILEQVWPDRVVTEQVVFQNISYLRALFGDKAIKTFSKKGYQWQLPLTIVAQDEAFDAEHVENTDAEKCIAFSESPQEHLSPKNNVIPSLTTDSLNSKCITSRTFSKWRTALGMVFLLVLIFVAWFRIGEPTSVVELSNEADVVYVIESSNFTTLEDVSIATINAQTLFDSPFSVWQRNNSNATRWLVASRPYTINDKLAIRFHIQGAQRGWHDYILADNKNDSLNQLAQLLSLLASTRYFEVESDHTALAELTLLIDKHPDLEQLNDQQIRLQFKLNELDRANALADRQLSTASSHFRAGLLYLLKAQINLWNKNNMAAEESVNQALAIFRELKQDSLEASALVELSWVHLANLKLRQGMQVLNQAASKARSSNEPLLEVTARLNQSFMASKASEVELSHTQLGLAKELITLHQLADEHQVRVLNNAVWMANSIEEKFALNQQILELPFSPQYEIYFYIAAESVRNNHIQQEQWQEAIATIKPWQRQSFQLLSQAHIEFAQNEWQKGVKHAKHAYRQAQTNYHKVDALDAALLLIQRQNNGNTSIDVSEYEAFIKQNATNRWLDQNSYALKQLSSI